MYILNLAWKNISNRKSSLAIVIFMALAMGFLLIVNAVFDGTENGIKNAFTHSFTGDFVVRPVSKMPLSLFGDETPVTGELSDIKTLIPYSECYAALKKIDGIEKIVPQISCIAGAEINGTRNAYPLFGITANDYLNTMDSIEIIEGKPFLDYEKGAMLSKSIVESIEKESGKKIHIGDTIQFLIADASTFKIRAVPITAIYQYPVKSKVLEKIVLVDHSTVRDLSGITATSTSTIELQDEDKDFLESSIEDLFSENSDFFTEEVDSKNTDISFIHEDLEIEIPTEPAAITQTAWNFIIGTLKDSNNTKKVIKKINKMAKENDWPLEAIDWRAAAGSTAIYLYWMRLIFNIGVFIVLITGFLVVNNTLVINVMDRTKEIGTLQAIGAEKIFIAKLFLAETLLLTISAGILGITLGFLGNILLVKAHIILNNNYLIQLFGSNYIHPIITASNAFSLFSLSIILGIIGWISPVKIALNATPVSAMRGLE